MSTRSVGPVTVPGRDGLWELQIVDGAIAAIEPAGGGEPRLALPAFADLHLHADRAYGRGPRPAQSLRDAVELVHEVRGAATEADIRTRARRLLERAVSHGTLRARSHVDVDRLVERRALNAVLAVREELAGRLELEIVAFATVLADPAEREGERRLRDAVAAGADLVGTPTNFHRFRRASVDALLDLAAELGVRADVHVDETIDPHGFVLEHLADATLRRGLAGRVSASHACVLSALPRAAAARTIDKLAEARITVIALPALNLYLQDRGNGTPSVRGLTRVRELIAAGVEVRFGSDNVGDVFYPYGDADPLEAAFLGSVAGHVEDEDSLLAAVCGGRRRIDVGDRADLVLVDAASLREAIARRPSGRTVLRAGEVVAT
jgi:cytosine/creatinine deaminase